jgi:hypothetical protein
MLPKDRRAVAAIHEAGHAVVSLALRTGVTSVDIKPGKDGREGLTSYHHIAGRFQGSRDVLERRCSTVLGGMAAVWLASGKREQDRLSLGDRGAVWIYVYEILGIDPVPPTDEEARACRDPLFNRAVAILEARWGDVEAVAAALLNEDKIDRKSLFALTYVDVARA